MIDCDGLPYSWVDARTRTGQSGSPVVAVRISDLTITNLDGSITFLGALPEVRLVGVYSGRMNAESDLGRVWKLAALKELLTDGTSATVDFTPPQ
jgi:hypothetical protein